MPTSWNAFFLQRRTFGSSLLDLLLILIGAALAFWLVPVPFESLGL